ncbi:MAG: M23 family metallopeptidase [Alphaproteobacteria bacterium]|nr:M23 family metallopeptidase [Alphaproteobacteria bacterium]
MSDVLGALVGDGTIFGIGGLPPREKGRSLDPGRVSVDFDDDADTLTVTNTRAFPITFSCELTRVLNVTQKPSPGFQEVLAPGESFTVRFKKRGPGEKDFGYHWAWETGDWRATHDPAAHYLLPWSEGRFEVIQTWSGSHSHAEQHAVDVAMPVGTEIRASRAGRVIAIEDGWPEGGPDRRWIDEVNVIRILHADGTYASYVHLQAGGMKVALGDEVQAGQPIGLSGNSGWTTAPHLHFVVRSALDAWVPRSHPARFDVDGQPVMLTRGRSYP